MNFNLMHPAEQIVMLINRVYQKGLTTTSGGNLSIMDSEGVIWITPSGIDKGSLTPADICKVLPDGTVIGSSDSIWNAIIQARDNSKSSNKCYVIKNANNAEVYKYSTST